MAGVSLGPRVNDANKGTLKVSGAEADVSQMGRVAGFINSFYNSPAAVFHFLSSI